MGGVVLGILVWQEGGESVAALLVLGAAALTGLAFWLVRRKKAGKPTLLDPDLFKAPLFRFGVTGQMSQQIALGGTMIALPIFLQMVLEYDAMQAGLTIAPAVAQHVRRRGARREAGRTAPAGGHHPGRLRAPAARRAGADPA